jgi:hypothetical protein
VSPTDIAVYVALNGLAPDHNAKVYKKHKDVFHPLDEYLGAEESKGRLAYLKDWTQGVCVPPSNGARLFDPDSIWHLEIWGEVMGDVLCALKDAASGPNAFQLAVYVKHITEHYAEQLDRVASYPPQPDAAFFDQLLLDFILGFYDHDQRKLREDDAIHADPPRIRLFYAGTQSDNHVQSHSALVGYFGGNDQVQAYVTSLSGRAFRSDLDAQLPRAWATALHDAAFVPGTPFLKRYFRPTAALRFWREDWLLGQRASALIRTVRESKDAESEITAYRRAYLGLDVELQELNIPEDLKGINALRPLLQWASARFQKATATRPSDQDSAKRHLVDLVVRESNDLQLESVLVYCHATSLYSVLANVLGLAQPAGKSVDVEPFGNDAAAATFAAELLARAQTGDVERVYALTRRAPRAFTAVLGKDNLLTRLATTPVNDVPHAKHEYPQPKGDSDLAHKRIRGQQLYDKLVEKGYDAGSRGPGVLGLPSADLGAPLSAPLGAELGAQLGFLRHSLDSPLSSYLTLSDPAAWRALSDKFHKQRDNRAEQLVQALRILLGFMSLMNQYATALLGVPKQCALDRVGASGDYRFCKSALLSLLVLRASVDSAVKLLAKGGIDVKRQVEAIHDPDQLGPLATLSASAANDPADTARRFEDTVNSHHAKEAFERHVLGTTTAARTTAVQHTVNGISTEGKTPTLTRWLEFRELNSAIDTFDATLVEHYINELLMDESPVGSERAAVYLLNELHLEAEKSTSAHKNAILRGIQFVHGQLKRRYVHGGSGEAAMDLYPDANPLNVALARLQVAVGEYARKAVYGTPDEIEQVKHTADRLYHQASEVMTNPDLGGKHLAKHVVGELQILHRKPELDYIASVLTDNVKYDVGTRSACARGIAGLADQLGRAVAHLVTGRNPELYTATQRSATARSIGLDLAAANIWKNHEDHKKLNIRRGLPQKTDFPKLGDSVRRKVLQIRDERRQLRAQFKNLIRKAYADIAARTDIQIEALEAAEHEASRDPGRAFSSSLGVPQTFRADPDAARDEAEIVEARLRHLRRIAATVPPGTLDKEIAFLENRVKNLGMDIPEEKKHDVSNALDAIDDNPTVRELDVAVERHERDLEALQLKITKLETRAQTLLNEALSIWASSYGEEVEQVNSLVLALEAVRKHLSHDLSAVINFHGAFRARAGVADSPVAISWPAWLWGLVANAARRVHVAEVAESTRDKAKSFVDKIEDKLVDLATIPWNHPWLWTIAKWGVQLGIYWLKRDAFFGSALATFVLGSIVLPFVGERWGAYLAPLRIGLSLYAYTNGFWPHAIGAASQGLEYLTGFNVFRVYNLCNIPLWVRKSVVDRGTGAAAATLSVGLDAAEWAISWFATCDDYLKLGGLDPTKADEIFRTSNAAVWWLLQRVFHLPPGAEAFMDRGRTTSEVVTGSIASGVATGLVTAVGTAMVSGGLSIPITLLSLVVGGVSTVATFATNPWAKEDQKKREDFAQAAAETKWVGSGKPKIVPADQIRATALAEAEAAWKPSRQDEIAAYASKKAAADWNARGGFAKTAGSFLGEKGDTRSQQMLYYIQRRTKEVEEETMGNVRSYEVKKAAAENEASLADTAAKYGTDHNEFVAKETARVAKTIEGVQGLAGKDVKRADIERVDGIVNESTKQAQEWVRNLDAQTVVLYTAGALAFSYVIYKIGGRAVSFYGKFKKRVAELERESKYRAADEMPFTRGFREWKRTAKEYLADGDKWVKKGASRAGRLAEKEASRAGKGLRGKWRSYWDTPTENALEGGRVEPPEPAAVESADRALENAVDEIVDAAPRERKPEALSPQRTPRPLPARTRSPASPSPGTPSVRDTPPYSPPPASPARKPSPEPVARRSRTYSPRPKSSSSSVARRSRKHVDRPQILIDTQRRFDFLTQRLQGRSLDMTDTEHARIVNELSHLKQELERLSFEGL